MVEDEAIPLVVSATHFFEIFQDAALELVDIPRSDLLQERFNPRRGGVQRLLDPQDSPALCRELIQTMALSAGPGGFARLKASLMDAAA